MEQIFARLRNVEVSEGFIKGSGLSGLAQGMAYYGTLERVRGVRPLEIGNVSLGHVLGGHVKRDGHRRPITFFVKVAFDITVREFPTASLFGDNNLKIRLDVVDLAVPAQGLFGQAPAEAVSRDMAVEREIIVEAWIHEDAQTDAPVDLEIDKINAW